LFGTKLYDLCKEEGKILDDSYEFYDTSISSPTLIPKIKFVPTAYKDQKAVAKIIKFAYSSFYLRYYYLRKLLKSKKYTGDLADFVNGVLLFFRIILSKLN
jgi:hypothetical protein